jgi:hypothetical protein
MQVSKTDLLSELERFRRACEYEPSIKHALSALAQRSKVPVVGIVRQQRFRRTQIWPGPKHRRMQVSESKNFPRHMADVLEPYSAQGVVHFGQSGGCGDE